MDKFFTVEEVAGRYRYTTETVWKKCRMHNDGDAKGWPHRRDGRVIRFTEADIEAIDKLMNPAPAQADRKTKRKSLAA